MTIGVAEARERVRTYLQDHDYVRWGKHEINQYLHEAAEDFVSRVGYPIVSSSLQSSTTSSAVFLSDPAFTVGETITGATTGATAKVITNGTIVTFDTITLGFVVGEQVTGATGSGYIQAINYNYELTLPDEIQKLTHAEVDGIEVPIVTESEMRHYAVAGTLHETETTQDKTVKIFGSPTSTNVKWRETTGKCKAIVVTSATSDKFRIYPIPSESQKFTLYGVYRPLHASDLIPFQFDKGGILTPVALQGDTLYNSAEGATNTMIDGNNTIYRLETNSSLVELSTSTSGVEDVASYPLRGAVDFRLNYELDRKFINVLVYGSLERAYLKEHDLRNVEKSEYYRQKKESLTQEAVREDALNPASISGGINFNRLTSTRKWQYQFN